MDKQQLLQEIFDMMELFKNGGSSCGRRQYLSSAIILADYERRLSEEFNCGEIIEIEELEEMWKNAKKILENLGISQKNSEA